MTSCYKLCTVLGIHDKMEHISISDRLVLCAGKSGGSERCFAMNKQTCRENDFRLWSALKRKWGADPGAGKRELRGGRVRGLPAPGAFLSGWERDSSERVALKTGPWSNGMHLGGSSGTSAFCSLAPDRTLAFLQGYDAFGVTVELTYSFSSISMTYGAETMAAVEIFLKVQLLNEKLFSEHVLIVVLNTICTCSIMNKHCRYSCTDRIMTGLTWLIDFSLQDF